MKKSSFKFANAAIISLFLLSLIFNLGFSSFYSHETGDSAFYDRTGLNLVNGWFPLLSHWRATFWILLVLLYINSLSSIVMTTDRYTIPFRRFVTIFVAEAHDRVSSLLLERKAIP